MNRFELDQLIEENMPRVEIANVKTFDSGWDVYFVLHGNVRISSVTVTKKGFRHISLQITGSIRVVDSTTPIPNMQIAFPDDESHEWVWNDVPDEVREVGELAWSVLQDKFWEWL